MSKIGDTLSSLYGGYKKFSLHRNKFFSYRYFIRNYDEAEEIYVDDGRREILYNGKECYFPKEIPNDFQPLKYNYFWDGKHRHPIELPGRYGQSYNGNTIYAMPFVDMAISSEQQKIFGFNKEELKNKTIVIEVDKNGEAVSPKLGEALYYSFSGGIKPTSFRVVDRKTNETRWLPSLIMLPFNLGGAACNFVCGFIGGILNKIGGGLFLNIAKHISKGLDDEISANKNDVLKSNQRLLKTRSAVAFIFESLASLFIATGSVVEGTGRTADALLRTPNLMFHHDDLDRKATWANIKSSITNTYHDLSSIKKHTTNSLQACTARINGDVEKLQEIKGINTNKDTDDKASKQNQKCNSLDKIDKNKIKEAGQGLSNIEQSTMAVGTKEKLNNRHQSTVAGQHQSQTARSC
ncbi:hypothetical protein [Candidatus Mesenet endosymbiont of Phosphuga atrata]|uniref:hypothetical protein n=1 Tax=Candidatus Mesenet endosymbiont of Phosphuga atrata TaxID=3066221 RepID=UPI0030D27F80